MLIQVTRDLSQKVDVLASVIVSIFSAIANSGVYNTEKYFKKNIVSMGVA